MFEKPDSIAECRHGDFRERPRKANDTFEPSEHGTNPGEAGTAHSPQTLSPPAAGPPARQLALTPQYGLPVRR